MKDTIKAQLENEYIRVTGKELESLLEEKKVDLLKRIEPRFLIIGDYIMYGEIKLQYTAGGPWNIYRPWETLMEFDLVK